MLRADTSSQAQSLSGQTHSQKTVQVIADIGRITLDDLDGIAGNTFHLLINAHRGINASLKYGPEEKSFEAALFLFNNIQTLLKRKDKEPFKLRIIVSGGNEDYPVKREITDAELKEILKDLPKGATQDQFEAHVKPFFSKLAKADEEAYIENCKNHIEKIKKELDETNIRLTIEYEIMGWEQAVELAFEEHLKKIVTGNMTKHTVPCIHGMENLAHVYDEAKDPETRKIICQAAYQRNFMEKKRTFEEDTEYAQEVIHNKNQFLMRGNKERMIDTFREKTVKLRPDLSHINFSQGIHSGGIRFILSEYSLFETLEGWLIYSGLDLRKGFPRAFKNNNNIRTAVLHIKQAFPDEQLESQKITGTSTPFYASSSSDESPPEKKQLHQREKKSTLTGVTKHGVFKSSSTISKPMPPPTDSKIKNNNEKSPLHSLSQPIKTGSKHFVPLKNRKKMIDEFLRYAIEYSEQDNTFSSESSETSEDEGLNEAMNAFVQKFKLKKQKKKTKKNNPSHSRSDSHLDFDAEKDRPQKEGSSEKEKDTPRP